MSKTGFLKDSFDPRDYWLDEVQLLCGEETKEIPDSYVVPDLKFDHQAGYPYCVSYAITTALEKKIRSYTGVVKAFSQPHLFHHSGGSQNGSWIRRTLNTVVDKGCIPEARLPRPQDKPKDWFDKMQKEAESIPFADSSRLKVYARVAMEEPMMKQAIIDHGPIVTSLSTNRANFVQPNYWSKKFTRFTKTDTHAVLIAGWDEDEEGKYWIIFDSLNGGNYGVGDHQGLLDGYHRISREYDFYSGYVMVELPVNVNHEQVKEEVIKNREVEFSVALSHYGKPRDFSKEVEVANELRRQFEDFKNQSVLEAAGKFWTTYINAVAYGNYSYRDCINDCYNWRRTGNHAFNLNKVRG